MESRESTLSALVLDESTVLHHAEGMTVQVSTRRGQLLQRLVGGVAGRCCPSYPAGARSAAPHLMKVKATKSCSGPRVDKTLREKNWADAKLWDFEAVNVGKALSIENVLLNMHDASVRKTHQCRRAFIQGIDHPRDVVNVEVIVTAHKR